MVDRPDRFEGLPPYVEDFWKRAQVGLAEEVDGTIFKFTISEKDASTYPELKPGMRIMLAESVDGYIHHELFPPRRTN